MSDLVRAIASPSPRAAQAPGTSTHSAFLAAGVLLLAQQDPSHFSILMSSQLLSSSTAARPSINTAAVSTECRTNMFCSSLFMRKWPLPLLRATCKGQMLRAP